MAEPKQLVLGYDSIHPFAKVDITDRASVQELLRTLLDPLQAHFSPLKARIRTPGGSAVRFDQTAAEIEGTCRPMWGLASLLAGGGEYDGTAWWIEALKQGTFFLHLRRLLLSIHHQCILGYGTNRTTQNSS
jgi:hypothetical protein